MAVQALIAFISGADSEDLHGSFQIVCQYVQTHLGTHARHRFSEEMRRSHPRLERAERMFDGLASYSRCPRCAVQPPLHRIEYVLVFPPSDAPIIAGRAFEFNGTSWAG
jgi:hypothetical protein